MEKLYNVLGFHVFKADKEVLYLGWEFFIILLHHLTFSLYYIIIINIKISKVKKPRKKMKF